MMKKCVSKERLDCFHLTKETRDEFLKAFEPNLGNDKHISIIEESDREIVIYYLGMFTLHYLYNHWYVINYEDEYECYTEEEFKDRFELVED